MQVKAISEYYQMRMHEEAHAPRTPAISVVGLTFVQQILDCPMDNVDCPVDKEDCPVDKGDVSADIRGHQRTSISVQVKIENRTPIMGIWDNRIYLLWNIAHPFIAMWDNRTGKN